MMRGRKEHVKYYIKSSIEPQRAADAQRREIVTATSA
jgi:hypothetical protein